MSTDNDDPTTKPDRDQVIREALNLIDGLSQAALSGSLDAVRAFRTIREVVKDTLPIVGRGSVMPVNGSHCTPLCSGCEMQLGGVHRGPASDRSWGTRRGSA